MTSPVEEEKSPVGQGYRAWTRGQKQTFWACGVVLLAAGCLYYSFARNAAQNEPKKPEPAKMAPRADAYKPADIPVMQTVAAMVPQPVKPTVGPQNFSVLPNTRPKASDNDILVITSQGPSQTATTAARPSAGELQPPRVSELSDRLTGTELAPARAKELPNPDFLIAQGRIISCVQQTRIDSTYPGFVSAIIPQAIYSETGNVVLLDAGTKLFGSMEKAMLNGVDRQFVLWQRATTPPLYDRANKPHQYSIALHSPAADALGATGLDGDVDRHIWRKLGGAVMLSLLEGGIQAGTAALQPQGGTNINVGQGMGQLPQQLLASTISIPDVLTRNQGASCSVFVARDLDLSSIYQLRKR